MQILVRKEIYDVFEEIDQPVEPHILTLIEAADFETYTPVSFSLGNSTLVNVDDSSVADYLQTKNINIDNTPIALAPRM